MSAAIAAAAIGGAAVIGGAIISSNGAKSAADTQANAADAAAQTQWNEFQAIEGNEQPYMNLGSAAITPLLQAMGYNVTGNANGTTGANGANGTTNPLSISVNPNSILQQQFTAPTLAQVRQTPGYQFQLDQGEQAINNSAAARGGLLSGATLKDLLSYSQGLADTTYQQDFNNALSTFNTNYNSAANNANRLSGLTTMGQNAATNVGNQGLQTAANAGQLTTSAANASAAGTVASSNALSGALSSLGNSASTYGLLSQLTGQGSSSYGAGSAWAPSTGVSSDEAAALSQGG
ncbi:hypothetical protein G3N58_17050 [Paraburkholderia sp. Ac-20342]|uniref:hypothetical protein n=1 Tax=unclassified Paraburkholderia TaxID=2615204 RepID=UPI001423931E|nr:MULTISPECIES: hypothetical protein [unclassified Paraburkholderia]MBN3848521.1 hypothetical protein [Paraburkholderia sp. Ac-20342]NIF78885.1 hypothetical protein [Paraburkholderia sp. Cy-641]